MKKNITFYFFSITQIILMNACLFGFLAKEPEERGIPASDFLVDISSFPDNWSSTYCTASICKEDNGISSAEIEFFIRNEEGHVYEEVYRLRNKEEALKLYDSYYNGETKRPEVREPFVEYSQPLEMHFESKFAETSSFVCGVDVIPQCKYFAQYENYFIYFYFDHAIEPNDGGLTYEQIEIVLEAFDEKIELIKSKKEK